jgi:hypothetical protein
MKRILPFLVALLSAAPAFAAPPAPASAPATAFVDEARLPAIFRKEPPYMQNRICGELMVSMARMSASLYEDSGITGAREAAVTVATRGMTFVMANASLTEEEKARAKSIADELEKEATPTNPTILAYKFCEERAERWVTEGVVTPAEVKATEQKVRAALDQMAPLKNQS